MSVLERCDCGLAAIPSPVGRPFEPRLPAPLGIDRDHVAVPPPSAQARPGGDCQPEQHCASVPGGDMEEVQQDQDPGYPHSCPSPVHSPLPPSSLVHGVSLPVMFRTEIDQCNALISDLDFERRQLRCLSHEIDRRAREIEHGFLAHADAAVSGHFNPLAVQRLLYQLGCIRQRRRSLSDLSRRAREDRIGACHLRRRVTITHWHVSPLTQSVVARGFGDGPSLEFAIPLVLARLSDTAAQRLDCSRHAAVRNAAWERLVSRDFDRLDLGRLTSAT